MTKALHLTTKFKAGRRTINVAIMNPGGANTIVMVHDFRSSHLSLLRLASQFPNHRIIIPDMPGQGESDPLFGPTDIESLAENVHVVMKHYRVGHCLLLGHGIGALVALHYATIRPKSVDRLILIAPIPRAGLIQYIGAAFYGIAKALPEPYKHRWLTYQPLQDRVRKYLAQTSDARLERLMMRRGHQDLRHLHAKAAIETYLSTLTTRPHDLMVKLRVPTLVLAGRKDHLATLRGVQNTYNTGGVTTFRILPNAGHFAPMEHSGSLANVIHTWLNHRPVNNR